MEAIEAGVADIFGGSTGEAAACVGLLGRILAAPAGTEPVIHGNPWCGGGSPAAKERRKEIRQSH